MAKSIEDKVLDFLRARGEAGAPADELAREFMQAKTVGRIADAIVGAMLGKDARFEKRPDGRWRAAPEPKPAPGSGPPGKRYTVVEFLVVANPAGGEIPLEAAALRAPPGDGRNEAHTLIQYAHPLPPATQLPEGFDRAALRSALPLAKVLDGLAKFSRGTTVLSFEKTPGHARLCAATGTEKELDYLSLKALARRMQLVPANATLETAAEALGVFCPEHPRAAERARVCADLLAVLRERYVEQRAAARAEAGGAVVATAAPAASLAKESGPAATPGTGEADFAELQKPAFREVDFSRYNFDAGFLLTMTESPGIYVMADASGNPIYVGKAKNLRERVGSYFRRRVQRDEKTDAILERVYDIAVQPVGSELEALLAEHRAIREYAPPINTQYDVHERHPSRERPENTVLILPSLAEGHVELFLVARGAYLTQFSAPRDDADAARDVIQELYFTPDAAPDESERAPEELEILWSWLERNKDGVNRIDVTAAGTLDEVMRLLAAYLKEEPREGRMYHR